MFDNEGELAVWISKSPYQATPTNSRAGSSNLTLQKPIESLQPLWQNMAMKSKEDQGGTATKANDDCNPGLG